MANADKWELVKAGTADEAVMTQQGQQRPAAITVAPRRGLSVSTAVTVTRMSTKPNQPVRSVRTRIDEPDYSSRPVI
jgi:hypothetical protein